MSLRPAQKAAATRLGQDVCVVAGPGSGKTRVLIERFRWLVQEKHVSPLRILAITFTEKASTEIKQRLVTAFENAPGLGRHIERAYVSTIHGFCARLLQENAIHAGLDPGFAVLDEPKSQGLLREASEEVLDAIFEEQPEQLRALLEALDVATWEGGRQPDLAAALLMVYHALRTAGARIEESWGIPREPATPAFADLLRRVLAEPLPGKLTENQGHAHEALKDWARRMLAALASPPERSHFVLLADYGVNTGHLKKDTLAREVAAEIKSKWRDVIRSQWTGQYYGALRNLLVEALRRTDGLYRDKKRALAGLDFSDLEEQAIDLLRRLPAARARIQKSFDYILMDELQDTNRLQWLLLDLVRSPHRFFAVGDINQSIYGFRHADPEIFRAYRGSLVDRSERIDELHESHRSRAEIIQTVNAIFNNVEGIEPPELEPSAHFPAKDVPSIEVLCGLGDAAEQAIDAEARLLARRIRELEGNLLIGKPAEQRRARFSDMAVLARTLDALEPIQRALAGFQVPFLVTGGKTFFESREVRDLMHWLAVLANPRDEISLAGVLRSPLVGLRDETLLWLEREGGIRNAVLKAMDLPHEEDQERLSHFRELVLEMRAQRDTVSPDRLLARALDESGYLDGLGAPARANVRKFLAMLRDMHASGPRPLPALCEELDSLRAWEAEPEAPPSDSSNVVRLMSIHRSKGLEFPIVFVAALQRGVSGALPPICFLPEAGLGVRWRDPATADGVGDPAFASAAELLKRKAAAEEKRLLYVAMSRAQEHLVLSFARTPRPRSDWHTLVLRGLGLDPSQLCEGELIHGRTRVIASSQAPASTFPPPASGHENVEELLERPRVSGQHDSVASATSISIYAACPRKYYLARYLGWRQQGWPSEPAGEEQITPHQEEETHLGAAELGIQAHELLAGMPVADPHPEAVEMADRFRTSDLARRAARAARLEREFDFVMELEDVIVRGQIDLWFEEGGQIVIVDYKSDRVDGHSDPARLEPYALQLRIYALALTKLTGKLPGEALLYFLRSGREIPIALDAAAMARTSETVRAFIESQEEIDFPLREGEQCLRCALRHGLCPVGP